MANRSILAKTNSLLTQEAEAEDQTLFTKKDLVAGIKYDNVYITPSHIEFKEAIEGVSYRQRITMKNIGSKPAFIRIREPNSLVFQVKVLKNGMRVSPGLNVTTCVTYCFKRPSLLRAIIPIEINGKIFDYRVICTVAIEGINIEPKLIDFGTVDIGYSSGLKIVTIYNEGGKSTRFSIDLGRQNDLELRVKPLRGIVRPQKEVKLRIELIGINEGIFFSEFWIKSIPNIRVPIKVILITPRLIVYHPNTSGDFTLVNFPPTIEHTNRFDTFVLRNLSSRVSSYVVLGELDNEVKCFRDIDRKHYPAFGAFEIRPIEGRLNPFQGIIFEVKFSPTNSLSRWKQQKRRMIKHRHEYKIWDNRDFMAFIRIIRVHCIESENVIRNDPMKESGQVSDILSYSGTYLQDTMVETSSLSTSCGSNTDLGINDVIRLCLYGEIEEAQLQIEPDCLYFGDLILGEISQRVLRLTNPSPVAPIYLEFVPNPHAHCYPNWMELKPRSSIEVLIKIHGRQSLASSFRLVFDIKADTYNSCVPKRCHETIKVGSYSVKCMVNIIFKSKNEFLSKKNLPMKAENNYEIIKRFLRIPKWKLLHENYLAEITKKLIKCRALPFEKTISSIKANVLIPLSPLQIYKIHIYPTTFVFDNIAPKSYNYRRLVVKNKNNVPVMIRLISLSSKCICFPEGNLMILPPNSKMSKLIEYFADQIGKFNGYIDYVINDNHFFELNITADIIRKQLSLDKREIEFGKEWLNEETYRPMIAIIRITNKLSARTYFKWEIPTFSGFYIEPIMGSIRNNSILYVYARYEVEIAKTNSAQVVLKCESGNYVSLQLSVPRIIPNVKFVNDNANLGEISLNLPIKIIAVLQNFEFNELMYEVESASLIRGCNVNPLRGKITPRGIVILEVHLILDICCRFSTTIIVIIQRNLRLSFNINGDVTFPRLKVQPHRIDMKRISTDAIQIHKITATNIGTTMLKLHFPLKEYPEFRIFLSANCKNYDVDKEGITIIPGASQDFYLYFQPSDLASYVFYLPMVINRLLGPASMLTPKSIRPIEFLRSHEMHYAYLPNFEITPLPNRLPTIIIDCTVAASVTFFNKFSFLFKTTTNELVDELCIENRAVSREMVITINIEEFNKVDCPFTIEWSRGVEVVRGSDTIECTLQPGSNVFFVLEFKPKKHGSFSVEAPIYVRGELDGGMFNKLCLEGEFPASSIDVEPTEIYFTPVPLDTTIEENFRIRARHFDNAAVIRTNFSTLSRCSGDYRDGLLHVEFPDGNVVHPQSIERHVDLKGRIIFKSEQPVSFCLTIDFCDDRLLAVCSLKVYATADNSLLTIYKYLYNFDNVHTKNISGKYVSNLSISSDSGVEEDEGSSRRRGLAHDNFLEKSLSSQRNPIGKVADLKLDYKEEANVNNNGRNNKDGKWDNDKQELFKKMHFTNNYIQHEKSNDKKDDYEKYIQRIVTIMEEWMYSDPLKFYFYPSIPHGITAAFSNIFIKNMSNIENSKRPFMEKINPLSFINVLESLVGSDIHNYLGELWQQPLPKDDFERINYVLQLYEKILEFLISQGAHLPHVSARFLLYYDDYVISTDAVRNNYIRRKKSFNSNHTQSHEQLSQHLFETRSKNCWLDVILQTYKCFQLHKIYERRFQLLPSLVMHSSKKSALYRDSIPSPRLTLPKQYEIHEKAIRIISEMPIDKSFPYNYCPEEKFLLAWLQYHYEQQRAQNWMTDHRVILNPRKKHDTAEYRDIQNFHHDLSDSLVLIAVTVTYCSFLIDECFGNIFICPRSTEEKLHNAICLVNAWRKIRLGFIIVPIQLINPNEIQMLMLVVHLFQNLPTYIPHAKIKFNCSLSQTVTRQISISNPTRDAVNYLLLFMNNTKRFFTMLKPTSVLHVHAHGSGQMQIQFHAKKIRKIKTYLVLCGYAIGPHFGRNQTIVLEGHIDNLGIEKEYIIRSKLYEIVEINLKINVPYRDATEYDISMTDEQPTFSALKMTRWCDLSTRKIPRRLFLNQRSIIVAENALEAYLSLSVACIAPKERTFWLIFQAKTGDFIIQINSIWQSFISDRIVVEWTIQEKCVCSNQQSDMRGTCPFNITIPIPSRNAQLWKCVAEMFRKTLTAKERLFWSKYSDTYIELRLIRWLMGDKVDSAEMEFVHIFNTTVVYKITSSNKLNSLILPDSFTIQDVRPSDEQVPMIIHILPTTPPLYESTIILTSLDGNELRVYTVDFLRL